MAIWSSKNSVLTEKGREIFAKVQLGKGKLEISSVISGGTFIPTDTLKDQTEVTDPKQELSITGVTYKESGGVVDIKLTNTDLDEAYTLYQIGIYVTHPDYEGDVLYLLSECEEYGADLIPIPSETPVTLTFSLFLENSTESNTTIVIDNSGGITKEEFQSHVGDSSIHLMPGEKEEFVTQETLSSVIEKVEGSIKANILVTYNGGVN